MLLQKVDWIVLQLQVAGMHSKGEINVFRCSITCISRIENKIFAELAHLGVFVCVS